MRVLCCGGRTYDDYELVCRTLDRIHKQTPITCLIEGGAGGADRLCRMWAEHHIVPTETYEADWAKFGPSAGPLRNQQMIDQGKPDLVVAFPGNTGTQDMLAKAKRFSIPCEKI